MTKVRTYRIDVDEYAREWDAIVIGACWWMTSQHLWTAASFDAWCQAGNVPVVNSCGVLPDSLTPSNAMKKCVYDPNNCARDAFDYNNFRNTPTIPVVNDPVVTFKQGWVTMGSISLNQSWTTEIDLLAWWVSAWEAIDILNNVVSVKYDWDSICPNACWQLEVLDYNTIKSWAAAWATAVQANDLATVAMTGNYCDLINKPEIPSAQIQSDWCQTNINLADYIKNKPTIWDATITLQKNGTNVDCFTLNQTVNKCLNLVLNKCDVGLNNVDNTSDADKPVSTAVCEALSCKQDNITDLNTIRCNACDGKTASETIACYWDIVTHNVCEFATAAQWCKADSAVQPWDLCAVATSAKYCDLTWTPDLCAVALSWEYCDLSNTPNLCNVALSGKYCDLSWTPALCDVALSWNYNDLTCTPNLCNVALSGKYCDLTGTPSIPTDNCELANGCGYTTCTGTLVESDLQPYAKTCTLCNVATSWKYCDLTWTPHIPTDNCELWNSCGYTTCTGTLVSSDLQPYAKCCDLCTVSTTGKYCDLTWTPTIPTDNCQLANSCGYITKAVDDLTNYYLKCETYKKCEVDNLIANFGWFEVVSVLPTTNIKTNVIYLLWPIGTGDDKYEEWIYYNNTWTKIWETTTDLSNYAKCCDIPTDNCQLSNWCWYTTCTGTLVASDLTPYAKTCTLCTVATSGKYCDLTGKPTIPTDNCQLANSCWYTTCTWTLVASDIECLAQCCDIPTNNNQLTNGCGYTTCTWTLVASDLQPYAKTCTLCTVATSGKYCDLSWKPTIPTDNCQLSNSCGYTTCTGTLVASDLNPYAKTCDLKTVATSGKYCDLTGTPDLSVYALACNMACTLDGADNTHYPTTLAVANALCSAGYWDMLKATYDPCSCETDAFNYCNMYNKPALCTVATSGKYCDLTGKPTLATVATSGCYNDLTGKPTIPTDNCQLGNSCNYITKDVTNLTCYTPTASLATVATSWAYCDLTWTPTLACVACSGSYEDLCCKPNLWVYQTTANMVCSLVNADNSHYPSAKTVADALSACGAGDMLKATYDPCNKNWNAFDYNNFINTPSLCTVATSGKYCDLTGTPTIPAALNAWTGISIENNKINAQNLYVINEDAIDVTYTWELWVAPYNESYCYTNVCINPNCWVHWVEGAMYTFNLDTKVATSKCRNVRLKIGNWDYIPLMGTTAAAAWSSYFVKWAIRQFQYSTKYQECWALHAISDTNTTYSAMSCAEWTTGTCTCGRSITAACLKPIIKYHAVDDTAYASSWNGKTDIAPSKNAVYDKLSTMDTCISCKANTSSLCTVATTGKYCDLTGTPTLCTVATTGKYCDLVDAPDLSCKQDVLTLGTNLHYDSCWCLQVGDANNDLQWMRYVCTSYLKTSSWNLTGTPTAVAVLDASWWLCKQTPTCFKTTLWLSTVASSWCYCDLTWQPTIPTDNCQLANSCWYITGISCTDVTTALGYTPYSSANPSGYTTCTGTLTNSSLKTVNGCCLIGSWDICIQGWVTSVNWCTWAVNVCEVPSWWSTWQVLQKTSSWCWWATISLNAWDMCYSDFNWTSKSWSSVTLSLNSTITPSANFTVNKPSTIKEWQVYVLRVNNWSTAYTMTLGTGITNPWWVDLTLTPSGTDQFTFLATSSSTLELQRMWDRENCFLTQTDYDNLPSSKCTDGKTYFIIEE